MEWFWLGVLVVVFGLETIAGLVAEGNPDLVRGGQS